MKFVDIVIPIINNLSTYNQSYRRLKPSKLFRLCECESIVTQIPNVNTGQDPWIERLLRLFYYFDAAAAVLTTTIAGFTTS